MKDRKEQIMKLLLKHGKVKVIELSKTLSVSEVSIRKDLTDLEEQGRLKRVYGGAIPSKNRYPTDELSRRKETHREEKYLIAEKSEKLIQDEEVIYLDSSSINIHLAKLLVETNKNITVVTNMLEVANILSVTENIEICILPGFYQKKHGTIINQSTAGELLKFNIDRAFVGCSGFDLTKKRLSTKSMVLGDLRRTAILNSANSYVVMEKEKFSSYDIYNFIGADEVSNIITNLDEESSTKKLLEEMDIKVY